MNVRYRVHGRHGRLRFVPVIFKRFADDGDDYVAVTTNGATRSLSPPQNCSQSLYVPGSWTATCSSMSGDEVAVSGSGAALMFMPGIADMPEGPEAPSGIG